jgi:two-component system alkaline phosphatase synthesis response regulator PhoP
MSTKRILVVDDDRDMLTLNQLTLQRAGWEILAAQDGQQALDLADKQPPDLILLDLMMPGMDGYEVCRRLRADPRFANIPIIALTAVPAGAGHLAALDAGMTAIITKPIRPPDLVARLQTYL